MEVEPCCEYAVASNLVGCRIHRRSRMSDEGKPVPETLETIAQKITALTK
jgi:hypothetical protein